MVIPLYFRSTQVYEHWKTQFNTAVIQIVSGQFQQDRRVSKGGNDLYNKGTGNFMDRAVSGSTVTAMGLQICQPILYDHMYFCRNKTMNDLKKFCADNNKDLQANISSATTSPYSAPSRTPRSIRM